MSKRKMVPRKQLVVAAKFRSGSGVHGKSRKALRRAEKVQDYRESGRVARHMAFNHEQGGFEYPGSHQQPYTSGL